MCSSDLAEGFELKNYIGHDDDLEALHDDPRWDRLMDEVKATHLEHKKKRRSSNS